MTYLLYINKSIIEYRICGKIAVNAVYINILIKAGLIDDVLGEKNYISINKDLSLFRSQHSFK
ncbi:hypothetical protein [Inediibacterium massiliense]|uniref:hypothetical protein n=1 Tax=Inediibacterium massiliense TaxID=1658111 RepID=UPI0018FE1C36|nr:hypothetical protein [Inediibacterium massiliense]